MFWKSAFGDVYIPEEFEPPLPQTISEITGRSHGITSGPIEILDAKMLLIPEFTYNGASQGKKYIRYSIIDFST